MADQTHDWNLAVRKGYTRSVVLIALGLALWALSSWLQDELYSHDGPYLFNALIDIGHILAVLLIVVGGAMTLIAFTLQLLSAMRAGQQRPPD